MISGNIDHSMTLAAQLMAIEVISELLVSTSPQKLGEALTEHLRELTGARTVMVIVHRPEPELPELLNVSPARRINMFTPEELNNFCPQKITGKLPFFPEELALDNPLRLQLVRNEIKTMARHTLQACGELVGILLLFDLPGMERIAETNHVISILSAPIALALKNALAFRKIEQMAQELEQRVEERTSELKEKNVRLQMSEMRHQSILQTAMDGIWLLDSKGNFLEVNNTYCRMSGYSMQELLTMTVYDLQSTETLCETNDHIQRVIELGKDRFESQHRRKNGTVFDVEVSVQYRPVEGGQFVVFVQDISERKLAESGRLESEKRLNLAVSSSPIPIMIHDEDDKVLQLSKGWTTLSGYTIEDIPTLADWTEKAYGQRSGSKKDYIDNLFEIDTTVNNGEWLVTAKDGSKRIWDFQTTPLGKVNKGKRVLLSVAIDISEQKKAENERIALGNQLLQAQKMESIGRLAGGVAHDFNNMLTVILGHTELATMRLDPTHPINADLREIKKTAERSADLTRQLLAFARKQTVAPKAINLNDAVNGMLKMLQRMIGENLNLTWMPAPELWQVKVDPSQIDQILANLCVNARDAIDGTGRITIETENRTIGSEYCASNTEAIPGEYVRLSVCDNGTGMDKETLTHIFEPFFTTKEMGKGTGLGLATVYGAVKQNNGFINIYSEPGHGTIFSIYLPRLKDNDDQALTEYNVLPAAGGHETILLVEDEQGILDITSLMLEKQGYSVLKANNPREGIGLAHDHVGKIDMLFTDVIMPEMNGRDLAKNIQVLYPDIKLLFMSGYTADVISRHGVLAEKVHFIQKPFSLPNMVNVVRKILDN